MKIVAVMPFRNEEWVLGLAARAVLLWADALVMLDHASTDTSRAIANEVAAENPGRVGIAEWTKPTWEEMAQRQLLLDMARDQGATHIAIVDADEVLTGNLLPYIRQYFQTCPEGYVLQLPWRCLRGSAFRYHSSGIWAQQHVSTGFADRPHFHWSSAGRGGYDFHHRHPMGQTLTPFIPSRLGGLMHLQFISGRRLRAKQALYKLTEVLRWPDREPVRAVDERYNLAVYGTYTAPKEDAEHDLMATPADWWGPYTDLMPHLKPHALPWQEAEVLRLLAEHGPQRFAGLDLFGIGDEEKHVH